MEPARIRKTVNKVWKKTQKCLQSPPAEWLAGFHWYSTLSCYVFLALAGISSFVVRESWSESGGSFVGEDKQKARMFGLLGTMGVGALGIGACILHRRIRCGGVKEAIHLVLATLSHVSLLYYYSLFAVQDGLRFSKLNEANLNWKFVCVLFGWRLQFSAFFQFVILAANMYAFQAQSGLPEASVAQLVFTNVLYCLIALGGLASLNYILQKCYCCQELARCEHETLQKALSMTFDSQVWVSTRALHDDSLSLKVRDRDLRFKGLFGQVSKSGNLLELIAPCDLGRVTEAFRCATTSVPMLCAASMGAKPNHSHIPVDLLITKQHREFVLDNFAAVDDSDFSMYLVSIRLIKEHEKLPCDVNTFDIDDGPDCGLPRSLPQVLELGGCQGSPSMCASSDHLTTFTGVVFQDGAQDIETVIALGEKEHWLVPDASLRLSEEVLGSGAFGYVLESTYHGADVAVKVMARTGPAGMSSLLHELRLLRKLRHPNIMAFYGASIDKDTSAVRLVFEKAHLGPLDTFVEAAFVQIGGETEKYAAMASPLLLHVALALNYLHQEVPQIVHGDLKPSNVLLQGSPDGSQGLRAMLADFGLSRRLTENAKPMGLSLRWAAPEVAASGRCMPSTSTDVFSFGRLIYFVATARKPFQGMTLSNELVASGLDSLHWPKSMLANLCAPIAQECLNTDPALRPSIAQVHQIFTNAINSWCDEEQDDHEAEDEDEDARGKHTSLSL